MERIADATLREFMLNVASSFKHERVMPVGSVSVVLRKSLVDQDWQTQFLRNHDCDIQCWILDGSHCRAQPIQNKLPVLILSIMDNAQAVGEVER